jgi:hypothetical protein
MQICAAVKEQPFSMVCTLTSTSSLKKRVSNELPSKSGDAHAQRAEIRNRIRLRKMPKHRPVAKERYSPDSSEDTSICMNR